MVHSWQTGALALTMCALGANSAAQGTEQATHARFDAPVELTADGKPMRGILYPSPTLHDIDGDHRRELLIGDLPGYIRVAQPGAKRGGTAWGELEFLQSKDKKRLKLNNW
jgi:hypothetical protein